MVTHVREYETEDNIGSVSEQCFNNGQADQRFLRNIFATLSLPPTLIMRWEVDSLIGSKSKSLLTAQAGRLAILTETYLVQPPILASEVRGTYFTGSESVRGPILSIMWPPVLPMVLETMMAPSRNAEIFLSSMISRGRSVSAEHLLYTKRVSQAFHLSRFMLLPSPSSCPNSC